MRQLVLLGEAGTKRTVYFQKAAQALGVTALLCPWAEWETQLMEPALVKIDPPVFDGCCIDQQSQYLAAYQADLKRLAASGHAFYNTPEALWTALDKRRCKELLLAQGLPVTEMWPEVISSPAALRELLASRHWPGAFVKPRFGSAAAGVLAYRWAPKIGREVLYTCAALQDGQLVNTKTLRRLEDHVAIEALLTQVLAGETVVERWHAKAKHHGRVYDLRAVVQFGQLDYLVARTSRGPITNLQLNNGAVSVEQLGLPPEVYGQIEDICQQALAALAGLSYAGLDILLEEETLKPYIVEVNGQGDLLYQDIFADNSIYTHQVKYFLERRGETGWI